jgi:hypothetical protein
MSAGSIVGDGDGNHGVGLGVGTGVGSGVAVCCSKISSRLGDASGSTAMPGNVGSGPRGPMKTASVPPAKISAARKRTAPTRRPDPRLRTFAVSRVLV